jgi:hypothetical protein
MEQYTQRNQHHARNRTAERVNAINQVQRVDKAKKPPKGNHFAKKAQGKRAKLIELEAKYNGKETRYTLSGKFKPRPKFPKVIDYPHNKHDDRRYQYGDYTNKRGKSARYQIHHRHNQKNQRETDTAQTGNITGMNFSAVYPVIPLILFT